MKIKDGFLLRKVGGQYIAVASGSDLVNFNAMISTNDTGAFLWDIFKKGADETEAAAVLAAEYGIDTDTALADVRDFMAELQDTGVCE